MGKTWKFKFGMPDRIALVTLLQQGRGSYAEQKLAEKLCEDMLSKADRANFNLRTEGNQILWDTVGKDGKLLQVEKELEFGPEARDMIIRNLAMLDEAHELERMYMGVYERFILTPWPDPT